MKALRIGRLRRGELLCAAAALALLVVLALDWFGDESGYDGLGAGLVAFVVALALLGLAMVALTVRGRPVAWPVAAAVWTSALGILLWPVLLIRMVVFGPGDDDIGLWGWVGLVLAALVPAGAWLSMADERKDAPESAYTPPPARPLPS